MKIFLIVSLDFTSRKASVAAVRPLKELKTSLLRSDVKCKVLRKLSTLHLYKNFRKI